MTERYLLATGDLRRWVDTLAGRFRVLGPVPYKRGQTVFEEVRDGGRLDLDYCSTMTSPRCFIYPSQQDLFGIDRETGTYTTIDPGPARTQLIFGIHPCDMHAVTVLDRTFLGAFKDFYYTRLRQETLTVVLNCNRACEQGFCASMGTGPFLQISEGYDVVMTAMGDKYLLEPGSQRGRELIETAPDVQVAGGEWMEGKTRLERDAIASFTKSFDTEGLPELLMETLEHPVYKETADARCLGCTNCTMVCPTCYCYRVIDRSDFGPRMVRRSREWDSCQELHFAEVHLGNFRAPQQARLRQFVTHKLSTWLEQYGCFGCVGCGRCMTWCPTKIDLTEIAAEIRRDPTRRELHA